MYINIILYCVSYVPVKFYFDHLWRFKKIESIEFMINAIIMEGFKFCLKFLIIWENHCNTLVI